MLIVMMISMQYIMSDYQYDQDDNDDGDNDKDADHEDDGGC